MLDNADDLAYWLDQWRDCYPATYPPELWRPKYTEVKSGMWPFIRTHMIQQGGYCARCGEDLLTGHMCEDLLHRVRKGRASPEEN